MTKTSAIDKVVAAYSSKRRKISVEEWGGMDLYFGRLTTADVEAVDEYMRQRHGDDEAKWSRQEKNVLLMISKAETKDGKQVFEFGDKLQLMRKVEFSVMMRVVEFMYGAALGLDLEKAKNEYAATLDSASD